MDNSKEPLIIDLINTIFLDYEYRYMMLTKDIKKHKTTNELLFYGKPSGIQATKTVKTALSYKTKCVGCGLISKYTAVVQNKDTGRYNVIFLVEQDGQFMPLTKDHILAKARGGTDTFKNLQCMCSYCNTNKGDSLDYPEHQLKDKDIIVDKEHYHSLVEKQKDFSFTRKNIKKLTKKLPWWMKVLGVNKIIEKELKSPLVSKGYYSDGVSRK